MRVIKFLDEHEWACAILITILAMATIIIFLNHKIIKMWNVQSQIVIHDYGHTFETIEDWKLERIEKFEKSKEEKK